MRAQAMKIVGRLEELYPDVTTFLDHTNAFELLVATVLSAQTTDARVNMVTPKIFNRWPDASSLAQAPTDELFEIIRPLGFARRRVEQITTLAQQLVERHGGVVPEESSALEALAGVGRKTANVVRGNWFGHPALTVDTHVGRISQRFGWTRSTNPLVIEDDVTALTPGVDWSKLSYQIIVHGRTVCTARVTYCNTCALSDLCPSASTVP